MKIVREFDYSAEPGLQVIIDSNGLQWCLLICADCWGREKFRVKMDTAIPERTLCRDCEKELTAKGKTEWDKFVEKCGGRHEIKKIDG